MNWTKLGVSLAAAGALAFATTARADDINQPEDSNADIKSNSQPDTKATQGDFKDTKGKDLSGAGMNAPAMKPPTAGPDDTALMPLFGKGGTWSDGRIAAGAMGEGSPATTSKGKAVCKPINDGLWYACDVTDTMGTGANAMTMRGHMVVGYDRDAKAYKAVMVDNMGTPLTNMDGKLEGKKLTLETPTEITSMGQTFKDRLTFDFSDPNAVRFTDEHQLAGKEWQPFEQATMRPEGAHRQARHP